MNQEECTFHSTAKALSVHEAERIQLVGPALHLQYVSPLAAVREKSVEAEKRMEEFTLESLARVDVYKSLLQAQENVKAKNVELTAEEQLLLKKMISDRTRSGLGLDEGKRRDLLKVRDRIQRLEIDFATNCSNDNSFLLFTKEQLDGVPEDIIKRYSTEEGRYKITLKGPDVSPVLLDAYVAYEGRAGSNTTVLEEIVKLRHSAAQLLGYPNHAAYVLEERMAKNTTNVLHFLNDLKTRTSAVAEQELQKFLALKQEVVEARGEKFDGKLHFWDYQYFSRLDSARRFNLDHEKIKEYFPVHLVVPAVLNLFHRLLNVEFIKIPDADLWHKDTELYAAWDGQDPDEFLGYLYLDLFPRPSAFGGFGIMGFTPGCDGPDGGRYYPTMTMKANFSKPTEGRPALLTHSEVVILLHEMGHAVHALCTKTAFAEVSEVCCDFVEAPSQLLENWLWYPILLKEISSHFERPAEKLDDSTISNLVKSRRLNQGLQTLLGLHRCYFDMKIHMTDSTADLTKLWCDLKEEMTGMSNEGHFIAGQSSFDHLVLGYSAGLYAYRYSEVFSADMFKTVFEKDPMNAQAGQEYRRKILRPGGSRDPMDLLKDFLGREPNNSAFLEWLQCFEP